MLQTSTVEAKTFQLLKRLMSDERLSDFILAGGTNLALQIGHRKSYDLDMFPNVSFDAHELEQYLIEKYGFVRQRVTEKNTVVGFIQDVKVDFVAHIYPLLQEPVVEDGIRLYSLPDIASMKLVAISDSGKRLKDFVDLAYLSTIMSLRQMLESYAAKYPGGSPIHAARGFGFFEDIKFDVEINLCNGKKFEWKKIEKRIREMFKYETKIFETAPI
jgi:hypothetical protein